MRSQRLIGILVVVGAATMVTGCAAQARVAASAEADAPVVVTGNPTLVALDSGVWVMRDADRAVYYVDEHYWVVRDGTWYRSRSFEGGWVAVEVNVVPATIATRNHELYVHYRGEATARTLPAPRGEAEAKNPHDGPPGQDAIPGTGNQRKAEGEQPGHSPFTAKNEPPKAEPASPEPPKAQPSKPQPTAAATPAKKDKDKKKDDKKK